MSIRGYKILALTSFLILLADVLYFFHTYLSSEIYRCFQLFPIALICVAIFVNPKHGRFVSIIGIMVSLMTLVVVRIDYTDFAVIDNYTVIKLLGLAVMYCSLGVSLVLKGTGRHLPHIEIIMICLAIIFTVMPILMVSISRYFLNYNLLFFYYDILRFVAFVLMAFSISRMPVCTRMRKGAIYYTGFCIKCGSANATGSKFCTACGAKLDDGNVAKIN